jgi:hypothetical protein
MTQESPEVATLMEVDKSRATVEQAYELALKALVAMEELEELLNNEIDLRDSRACGVAKVFKGALSAMQSLETDIWFWRHCQGKPASTSSTGEPL